MNSPINKFGIIIIAAGNSSRLGQSKQLVKYKNQGLLARTLKVAKNTTDNITCVLGYQADAIKRETIREVEPASIQFVVNKNWSQGMGSSISYGVNTLENNESDGPCNEQCINAGKIDAIVILLCDQYLVNSQDLDHLINTWKKHSKKIVASEYFDSKNSRLIRGAPAIFPRQYFEQLKALREKGARQILQNDENEVISVAVKNASRDLDTKSDLAILRNGENYD